MSDIRRVVTIASDGTVTTVKDLEDSLRFFAVAGSFQFVPPPRKQTMVSAPRRYAGATMVAETHDNAQVTWKALVTGTTADEALQNIEDALSVFEAFRGRHLQWKADGATYNTYYELRGPATWTPTYGWAQFAQNRSLYIDITVPVAPLARGTASTINISSMTLPGVVQLTSPITGDGPALGELTLNLPASNGGGPGGSGGTNVATWALVAWTKRPGTPVTSTIAPFGVLEAENATLVGLTKTTTADTTNLSGGYAVTADASTMGSGVTASWKVDPSVMQPDEFTDTIDLELYARVRAAATVASPTIVAKATVGGKADSTVYTAEWGSSGRTIVADGHYKLTRLGTITLPVDTDNRPVWTLTLTCTAGGTGEFLLDVLAVAPARQLAAMDTGEAATTAAAFAPSVNAVGTTKVIRPDLTTITTDTGSTNGLRPGASMGGSPIELPPGNVDLLLIGSSLIPDDPTNGAADGGIPIPGVTGSLKVTPRYWMARGS